MSIENKRDQRCHIIEIKREYSLCAGLNCEVSTLPLASHIIAMYLHVGQKLLKAMLLSFSPHPRLL